MRKNKTISLLFSSLLFVGVSCQESQVVSEDQPVTLGEFMGETVQYPADFPKGLLNQSPADFAKYYESLQANANLRTSGEEATLTLTELCEIINPLIKKYPDLRDDKDITAKEFKRIYKDFPSITTEQEVREKADIIMSYYEAYLKEEVIPKVLARGRGKAGHRTTDLPIIDPGNRINAHEQSVILNHPRWVPAYQAAALKAYDFAKRDKPTYDGDIMNAFQHAAWNCLIIRYVIGMAATENNAADYARDGTSAHESPSGNYTENEPDNVMDLHNNQAGRKWMKRRTGWGFLGARDMPDDGTIYDNMKTKTTNGYARKKSEFNKLEILILHNSDPSVALNILYRNVEDNTEDFVYIRE